MSADDQIDFAEFTEALGRLTLATQTVTFNVSEFTIHWVKLLTGGWNPWASSYPLPMEPGMVTWNARRRRHRRAR